VLPDTTILDRSRFPSTQILLSKGQIAKCPSPIGSSSPSGYSATSRPNLSSHVAATCLRNLLSFAGRHFGVVEESGCWALWGGIAKQAVERCQVKAHHFWWRNARNGYRLAITKQGCCNSIDFPGSVTKGSMVDHFHRSSATLPPRSLSFGVEEAGRRLHAYSSSLGPMMSRYRHRIDPTLRMFPASRSTTSQERIQPRWYGLHPLTCLLFGWRSAA
jgi:hypothetical protein